MIITTRKIEEDNIFNTDIPQIDSYLDHRDFDPLSKAGIYLTDTLFEELCEAVSDDEVVLPSFGKVDLRDSKQLKQVYWRAVDADETIFSGG